MDMGQKTGVLVGKNISKKYGKQEVLKDCNITIQPGCIYGLLGRNGVGKTTLLGILTGQKTMNQGDVSYDGQKVWDNRDALSHICFSREIDLKGNLQINLKIKEYLTMGSCYYPNWDQAYADALIKRFHLDPKKRINTLSKGQTSMISIILALASKADITILDEPVAGLDVIAREEFYQLLIEDYTQTNRTFVVSTHIIEEASNVFERVLILDEGKIIVDNDTDSFINEFRFVRGQVGQIEPLLQQVSGLQVLSSQTLGKHTMIAVRGNDELFRLLEQQGLELEPMTLQNTFVALCGHSKGDHYE